MSWLEELQKIVPWVQTLPIYAKIIISLIMVLIIGLFLTLVWIPPVKTSVENNPLIVESYNRMHRVLNRLDRESGVITVNGKPVPKNLQQYYEPYLNISEYIHQHPGDIKGTNEEVWNNGGLNRSFIDDTQSFEAVTSNFATTYYEVSRTEKKK
jgi:hypothetical protein